MSLISSVLPGLKKSAKWRSFIANDWMNKRWQCQCKYYWPLFNYNICLALRPMQTVLMNFHGKIMGAWEVKHYWYWFHLKLFFRLGPGQHTWRYLKWPVWLNTKCKYESWHNWTNPNSQKQMGGKGIVIPRTMYMREDWRYPTHRAHQHRSYAYLSCVRVSILQFIVACIKDQQHQSLTAGEWFQSSSASDTPLTLTPTPQNHQEGD